MVFNHSFFRSGLKSLQLVSGSLFRAHSSSILKHLKRNAAVPLLENYRPVWPDPDYIHPQLNLEAFPVNPLPRKVPDQAITFDFSIRKNQLDGGKHFPHFKAHPGDMKVRMKVIVGLLGLDKYERATLIGMVGPRYVESNDTLTLTCDMFQDRVENKRYLLHQVEVLVEAARSYVKEGNEFTTLQKQAQVVTDKDISRIPSKEAVIEKSKDAK